MTPALPRLLLLAVFALAVALPAGWIKPAEADSFYFGVQSGHGHRHHHHPGPRYQYGYYAYPPVYYAPPPRVVYVPAPPPVVYVPEPALAAVPASPIYRTPNGQHCREYQATVSVGGLPQPSYGTACLQPDGSWRVVN